MARGKKPPTGELVTVSSLPTNGQSRAASGKGSQ
jgi:hypothetical protein